MSSLVQLLDSITKQQYEIKALTNDQIKVQPKAPKSYRIIVKALTEKTQNSTHTNKPKVERNYKVVLKNLHYSINTDDIKNEIEKLGHAVTNRWNIRQYKTKKLLPMFFFELKPVLNNKDIYNVEFLQQCKIKFESPK